MGMFTLQRAHSQPLQAGEVRLDSVAGLFDALADRQKDGEIRVTSEELRKLRQGYFSMKLSHLRHSNQTLQDTLPHIDLQLRIMGMTKHLSSSLSDTTSSYEGESVDHIMHLAAGKMHARRRSSTITLSEIQQLCASANNNTDYVEQHADANDYKVVELHDLVDAAHLAESAHASFGSSQFDLLSMTSHHEKAIQYVGITALKRLELPNMFRVPSDKLLNFLTRVNDNYRHVPYHSNLHGADVTHTMFYLLSQGGLAAQLEDWQSFACIITAACHDMGHFGLTNNFIMATGHDLALTHSWSSPLERMHLASMFHVMREPRCNILANAPADLVPVMRNLMVDMILATDMAMHAVQITQLEHLAEASDPLELRSELDTSNATLVLQAALHCADLGNPTKPFRVAYAWSQLVLQEFHAQGDRERELGLPISPGFDKTNLNTKKMATGQLFFNGVLVLPLWVVFRKIMEHLTGDESAVGVLVEQIGSNIDEWKKLIALCESHSARKIGRLWKSGRWKSSRAVQSQEEAENAAAACAAGT